MRFHSRVPLRRVSAQVIALVVIFAAVGGCDRRVPTGPNTVRRIQLSVAVETLRPGQSVTVGAVPLNAADTPVEAPVTWRTLTPMLLAVDATGHVTALAPGRGTVRATAKGVNADLTLDLVNPAAAAILVPADSLLLELPGPSVLLAAEPIDTAGDPIIGAPLRWTSEAERLASVSSSGVVTPVAVGVTTVTIDLDGVQATRRVRVVPAASETAPIVTAVSPALLVPGVPFVISGERFSLNPTENVVLVDGIPATVTSASANQLLAVLPTTGLPCTPTSDVGVQVTTAGGIGAGHSRLRVAPQRMLAVGEALVLPTAADAGCNELVVGEGRYLAAIVNTGRTLGAAALSLSVDGRGGLNTPAPLQLARGSGSRVASLRAQEIDVHTQLLERSGSAVHAANLRARSAPRSVAALQLPPVEGITPVRIPDLESAQFCSAFTSIGARTVYAGDRVVLLEDTASTAGGTSTLARTMDADITALGMEIETVIWPIIERFGDPLVMDSRLDDNRRVAIVLTPVMNGMLEGQALGAVVSCDFFPRAQFASSNVGEVLYLQVPVSSAPGMAHGTLARWRHEIRGTIAHELKHIVSFAERIVRGQPLEEPWLEEATARHAEERYARVISGATLGGNAGYVAIQCESGALLGRPECEGTPRQMRPHFEGLWEFLDAPATRSPLGPVSAGDDSFYGSGWSLLRWALDHAALTEEEILLALTRGGLSGAANLEARAGRNWDDMLARWALTLMTDDRAGMVQPEEPTLRLPSWALGDVFAGFCFDLGLCGPELPAGPAFTRQHPLRPTVAPMDFTLVVLGLPPGGFVPLELPPGEPGTERLLRLRSATGGPLPATTRLAIIRVE